MSAIGPDGSVRIADGFIDLQVAIPKELGSYDALLRSPSHGETGEEDIGMILLGGNLGHERIPNVLITRDQPDGRGDGEVVEDFHAVPIWRIYYRSPVTCDGGRHELGPR